MESCVSRLDEEDYVQLPLYRTIYIGWCDYVRWCTTPGTGRPRRPKLLHGKSHIRVTYLEVPMGPIGVPWGPAVRQSGGPKKILHNTVVCILYRYPIHYPLFDTISETIYPDIYM